MNYLLILWYIGVTALYGLTLWLVWKKMQARHVTTTNTALAVVATGLLFPVAYYALYVILWNIWRIAS